MDAEAQAVFDAAQSIADTEDVFSFLKGDGVGFAIGRQQHAALKLALGVHAKAHSPKLPKIGMSPLEEKRLALIDAILQVVRLRIAGEDPGRVECVRRLDCALEAYAAVHPTDAYSGYINSLAEKPPSPNETTTKGPETPTEPVKLKRRSPEGREKYLRERVFSMARDVVEAWLELDQSSQDHNPLRHDMVALWTAVNCYDMPRVDPDDNSQDSLRYATEFLQPEPEPIVGVDPIVPGLQPMFAEFKAGDVCVLTYPRKLSDSEIDAIRKRWKERVPGVQVIIEDSGPTISFLRPAKGDEDAKK